MHQVDMGLLQREAAEAAAREQRRAAAREGGGGDLTYYNVDVGDNYFRLLGAYAPGTHFAKRVFSHRNVENLVAGETSKTLTCVAQTHPHLNIACAICQAIVEVKKVTMPGEKGKYPVEEKYGAGMRAYMNVVKRGVPLKVGILGVSPSIFDFLLLSTGNPMIAPYMFNPTQGSDFNLHREGTGLATKYAPSWMPGLFSVAATQQEMDALFAAIINLDQIWKAPDDKYLGSIVRIAEAIYHSSVRPQIHQVAGQQLSAGAATSAVTVMGAPAPAYQQPNFAAPPAAGTPGAYAPPATPAYGTPAPAPVAYAPPAPAPAAPVFTPPPTAAPVPASAPPSWQPPPAAPGAPVAATATPPAAAPLVMPPGYATPTMFGAGAPQTIVSSMPAPPPCYGRHGHPAGDHFENGVLVGPVPDANAVHPKICLGCSSEFGCVQQTGQAPAAS